MKEKTLFDIIPKIRVLECKGDLHRAIKKIHIDSRKVSKGDVFVALKGTVADGHDFIDKAEANGAIAIVCEEMPEAIDPERAYIRVENSSITLGAMAHQFYNKPSLQVKLIGVTGTNGKTTVATLLHQLFLALGYKAGLISTVENRVNKKTTPSSHTTPDAVSINSLLADMVAAGCEYVFMEVSSHAIHQNRIAALHFVGAIFTNISHDHLDYHGTLKEYIETKKKFFDVLNRDAFALTNLDDKRGLVMVQNTKAKILTYALQRVADFKGKLISSGIEGLQMMINDTEAFFRMAGKFNAYNLLSVYGAAVSLGQPEEEVLQHMSALKGAEGRFEVLRNPDTGISGIVDYAHTPDALLNVLQTINTVKGKESKIITVVGCGGNRDAEKRPLMARVACSISDQVILTSDNPRDEDPEKILDDMEEGIEKEMEEKTLRISDRKQAIKTAVKLSGKGDILLIAGKGHEKYQEIKGEKVPFDDKKILSDLLLISV